MSSREDKNNDSLNDAMRERREKIAEVGNELNRAKGNIDEVRDDKGDLHAENSRLRGLLHRVTSHDVEILETVRSYVSSESSRDQSTYGRGFANDIDEDLRGYMRDAALLISGGGILAAAADVGTDGELDGNLAAAPPSGARAQNDFDYAFMSRGDIEQAARVDGSTAINDLLGSDDSIDILTNGKGEDLAGVIFQRNNTASGFDSTRYDITVNAGEVDRNYRDASVSEIHDMLKNGEADLKATPGMEDALYDEAVEYGTRVPDKVVERKILGGTK